jgi:uncharacterized coiled-coil protein SlyX
MTDRPRDAWLSLDEAAALWGVSRLRLREAIAVGALAAQRDNRGAWRVLGPAPVDFATLRAPPEKLIEALFDEIEELSGALEERGQEVERLHALTARQQSLIERALTLAESAPLAPDIQRLAAINEQSQALAERALTTLETREQALSQMNGLMTRALDTVAGLDAEVARQRETSEKQRALLDRVFELARASLDRLSGDSSRSGWLARLRRRKG